MDKDLVDAINKQINGEIYSAYLYLSMAAYFESMKLGGFAKWMKAQGKEEMSHAMKFFGFLNDVDERVVLDKIEKPPVEFTSAQEVFEKTLEHEKKVTFLINKLHQLARKVKDSTAEVLLQWFIAEQVEEEETASNILDKVKIIKPGSEDLVMLDRELGKRE